MKIEVKTVTEYLNNIPEDRKPFFNKLRKIILDNIPNGFDECLIYNMVGFVVPLKTYPSGYHVTPNTPLPFVNIASQKNFIALYHMGIYANPKIHDWFVSEYPNHCKSKLDMGKSCVRFKKMEDIPFDLIANLMQKYSVNDWIKTYENNIININI